MKVVLAVVAVLELFAAVFQLNAPMMFAACIGGAILAGTGYAILDRLDRIAEVLRAAKPPVPPTLAPPLLRGIPTMEESYDASRAVDAMLAKRGLGPKP